MFVELIASPEVEFVLSREILAGFWVGLGYGWWRGYGWFEGQ